MFRNSLKLLTLVLITLPLIVAGGVYYLGYTEAGLQTLARLAIARLGADARLGSIHGNLAGRIDIQGLELLIAGDHYRLEELQLDWSPRTLWQRQLTIDKLYARQLHIDTGPDTASPTDAEPIAFPDMRLPWTIHLDQARIDGIEWLGFSEAPWQAKQLQLSARLADEALSIQSLQLVTETYSASLTGTLGLYELARSTLSLQWQQADGDTLQSRGQLDIDGLPQDYRFHLDTRISGADFPENRWTLAGRGDLQQLVADQANGRTLDGSATGSAQLGWWPRFSWQAALRLSGINPGLYWTDWPGKLDGQLQAAQSDDGELQLHIQQLKGTLRGYPFTAQAQLGLRDELLDLQQLTLTSGSNRLSASGSRSDHWQLQGQLQAADLAALLPGWSGQLHGKISLTGSSDNPWIDATLQGNDLVGPSLSIEQLAGKLKLAAGERADQNIDLQLTALILADQHYDQAQLQLLGPWQRHRLAVNAVGEQRGFTLQAQGGLSDWQEWRGQLQSADWQLPLAGRWALQQPVDLTVGTRRIELAEACLTQAEAALCISARGNPQATLAAHANLTRFPVQALEELFDSRLQFSNLLQADIDTRLQAGIPTSATLRIDMGAGQISHAATSLPSGLQLDQGQLLAQLDTQGLQATLQLDLGDKDYLDASLALPGYQPARSDWRQQALALDLKGDLHDWRIVQNFLEDVGEFQGRLNLSLQGSGRLGAPRLSGRATLSDASLLVDSLGIELKPLMLALVSNDTGLNLSGKAKSGDGEVRLNGELNLSDITHWQADVQLDGEHFEVMHLPEAQILVAPALTARITPPAIHFNGELHIPSAHFRPKNFGQQTGRSSDVIIVDSTDTPPVEEQAWQVYSQLRLSLGEDVDINGLGLKGDLFGGVDVSDRPGAATVAQGELRIDRGSYEAYGRKLDIEQGQLLFSGGPIDNPGLAFRASRKVRDITAGIRVSGTLNEPELTLFSDPVMSESDIISYISFGRPLAQVGTGDTSAAESGLIAGGNLLGGLVGSSVGLEELGVESGDTRDDTAMVLGTYLSEDLYVRYRTGLYDAINEFHVIYDFTRNWGIRTVSSAEKSSAELRFSFER